MKKSTILLVLFILLSTVVFSQNEALRMTNIKTGKEKVIIQGKDIKVTTYDGKTFNGKFLIRNDSLILTNKKINFANDNNGFSYEKSIHLFDVAEISTKARWALIYGSISIAIGLILIVALILIFLFVDKNGKYASFVDDFILNLFLYGFYALFPGIVVLMFGKNYSREKWDFKIDKVKIQ